MIKQRLALVLAAFSFVVAGPVLADSYTVKTLSGQALFLNDVGDVLFANKTILHANGVTSSFSNPPGTCLPDDECYDRIEEFNKKDQVLWSRLMYGAASWAYFQLSNNSWHQLNTNEDIIGGGGPNNTGNIQNNAGQIIISYPGYIYSDGKYDSLKNAPQGLLLVSLNDSGQAVGFTNSLSPVHIDYLYSGGKFTKILYPGASPEYVYPDPVIGPSGAVADDSSKGFFLYQDGQYHNIDLPLSRDVKSVDGVVGIDNANQVLVRYTNAAGIEQSYLYSSGQFIMLNDPGSTAGTTYVRGFTPSGEIVGESSAGWFSYRNGVYTSFSIPGIADPQIASVNAEGEILGYTYSAADQQDHFFLAAPENAPEPASWMLIISGGAVAGLVLIRRKVTHRL